MEVHRKRPAWTFSCYQTVMSLLLCVMLAACGDNGEDRRFSLELASPKTLRFTWPDNGGETEYRLLEDKDGISGYTQIAFVAPGIGAYDHEVFLPARVDARYILQACNSGGCEDSAPLNVEGTLAEAVGYLKPFNARTRPVLFGDAVSLSGYGNTLAVGAYFESGNSTGIDGDQAETDIFYTGAVYVYGRVDGVWGRQAYVKASNTGPSDWFGWSVALSDDGNTMAVGAPMEASAATGINGDQLDDSSVNTGAVYIFTRVDGIWRQQAYIKASNAEAHDFFGGSIALSSDGNILAVGAEGEDSRATGINGDESDNSFVAGAVYVFSRSGSEWTQQAYVKPLIEGVRDFGVDVALSGDGSLLAVGAAPRNWINAISNGSVHVYARVGDAWSPEALLQASNEGPSDHFGASVALSGDGNMLAVGSPGEGSGAIGIGGDMSDNSVPGAGAVYIYTRADGVWSEEAYIKASNPGENDAFGSQIDMSSGASLLVVAARWERSAALGIGGDQSDDSLRDSGAVYVFVRSDGVWGQLAYVKAPDAGPDDNFGAGLALSSSGDMLAVGAPGEASAAVGIGGNQLDDSVPWSGAVYLY